MKSKIFEAVKPALILMLIAAIAAGALAGVNALTAGTIARRTEEAANLARREVIDADRFEEQTLTDADGKSVTYHTALDADGNAVGYVFTATATGKSGGLVVMTGISSEGKVTGVAIVEENETAGYVDKVKKAGLLEKFVDKVAALFSPGEDIDTVAQATKTSKGVIDGVNKAVAYYESLEKGVSGNE